MSRFPPLLSKLRVSVRRLISEVTDPASYRAIAIQARYPVIAAIISQTALGFGLVALLSRSLGAEVFGQYGVILTVVGLFQLVVGFQAETGVAKYLPQARQVSAEESRAYYSAGLMLRLGISGLALVAAMLLAPLLCRAYRIPELTPEFRRAAIALCFFMPVSLFFLACIQGAERPRRWATGTLLSAGVVLPAVIIGAGGVSRWGLQGVVTALLWGWAGAAVSCALLARGALGFLRPTRATAQVRELFLFVLPLAVVPLCGFGAQVISKTVLARAWGPVPVGQFEIALTLQQHLGICYHAAMTVLLPAWARLYSQRRATELLQSISHARGALLGLALVYGGILALGGPWIIPAIFGREQIGAAPAARVMGLVMPIMIAGWVASTTAVVSNRTSVVGWANLIWFSLTVPTAVALIPQLGALGAAVSWLTGYSVFTWYYLHRARPFFREVERWEKQGKR